MDTQYFRSGRADKLQVRTGAERRGAAYQIMLKFRSISGEWTSASTKALVGGNRPFPFGFWRTERASVLVEATRIR